MATIHTPSELTKMRLVEYAKTLNLPVKLYNYAELESPVMFINNEKVKVYDYVNPGDLNNYMKESKKTWLDLLDYEMEVDFDITKEERTQKLLEYIENINF